ncbi:crotonase/enoyl-CoA hydratase family protein [Rhizobium rhizogenes]|uniref:Crotonase/enoyl-CoA hydratase family protein n=1 Tax=Rhizobium rhizogenes TaxID=359 RepID=A0AA92C461_RHIRH|nr:crotonase/enoyl-CoA hydratase family protein [Rhizobium rhizogenes]PVE54266.1 crotonase/enoyl-CoA hydratase family protein [Rhizobium rhizogenes]PVE66758.1 crotonase/enoyl-CoA hydratase family protein [Agrobacterium tumefaciens]PVE76746.1 crotonase/enoyl-CoA hydratase family protein [Sphingomonas sp. TPD3009]
MSEDHILLERPEIAAGVQVIRFNRPDKKNAITDAMYRSMIEALKAADADEDIRAIVFLGTPGCFSAGNDMADFLGFAMSGGKGRLAAADFLHTLVGVEKPIVSGVDGLAIGIGTTLNLHCDLTVASSRSLFRTPFVDLALVPEAASSLLVPRIAGHQRAFALLAAGEGFSAEQAMAAGLIWKVVPEADVEAETLKIAANLASKPPQALKIARDLVRGDVDAIRARIDEEIVHFAAQLQSSEARAAFEAFMHR